MVLSLLHQIAESYPWMSEAACQDRSDLMLSPDPEDRPGAPQFDPKPGMAVCATCTVRLECLHYGLTESGDAGREIHIYGGFSGGERKRHVRPEWIRRGKRLTYEWVDALWYRRMSERWTKTWVDQNPLHTPDGHMGIPVQKPRPS